MNKIIPIDRGIEICLDEAISNKNLRQFLDCLDKAQSNPALVKLEAAWQKSKLTMIQAGSIKTILEWVAEHKAPKYPVNVDKASESISTPVKEVLMAMADAFAEDATAFSNHFLALEKLTGYRFFHQAALFVDQSETIKKSARIIDDHLSYIFGNIEKDTQPKKILNNAQVSFIKHSLLPDCIEIEGDLRDDGSMDNLLNFLPLALADFRIEDYSTYPEGCTALTIVDALQSMPQVYLDWFFDSLHLGPGLVDVPGAEELVCILLSMPLKTESDFLPLNIPRTHVLDRLENINIAAPRIDAKTITKKLFDLCFDYDAPAFTLAGQNFLQNEDVFAFNPQKMIDLVQFKINQLKKSRRLNNNKSVGTLGGVTWLGHAIYILEQWAQHDFDSDIAYLIIHEIDPDVSGAISYNQGSFSSVSVENIDFSLRSAHFAKIFNAALDEGWQEFALAVLTYFFFSQPSLCHASIKEESSWFDWSLITPCLDQAKNMHGFGTVVESMFFCRDVLKEINHPNTIDLNILSYWLVNKTIHAHDDLQPKRAIAESICIKLLGSESWIKLPPVANNNLTQAEMFWRDHSSDFGTGNIDFAHIINEYGKAIESVVRHGYAGIIQTNEFVKFYCDKQNRDRVPEHIDHGFLVNQLMKGFEKLPPDLKKVIEESNIKPVDKVLYQSLLDNIQRRNKASHPNPVFFEKDVLDIRNFLFKEKGLSRLLAVFP